MQDHKIKVVISGSFRKHYKGILNKIKEFEDVGMTVLSPESSRPVNPGDEFIVLETDETTDPKILEQKHLNAIYNADCLYIFNPDGYIGASTAMELGWAIALGKPVYIKEEIRDSTLKFFSGKVLTPQEIKKELYGKGRCLLDTINSRSSLKELQGYIRKVVKERGFDDETPSDIMLLMVEEIGELAKALRKHIGLKIDQEKIHSYNKLENEIADVLLYLLAMANVCNIDLSKALIEKEKENNKRVWERG